MLMHGWARRDLAHGKADPQMAFPNHVRSVACESSPEHVARWLVSKADLQR